MTLPRPSALTGSIAFAALLLFVQSAHAQGWSWPTEPENLQVMSDTTGPDELSRTMRKFTAALGVRCTHCHAGDAGSGLAGLDFASDEKRGKRVAREMMRMIRDINGTVLAGIDEPSGAAVTCVSCHRGQKIPPEPLRLVLLEAESTDGAEAALDRYDELKDRHFGEGVYNFGSHTLAQVGDRLITAERYESAVTILERGIEEYPDDFLIRAYAHQAYLGLEDTLVARIHLENAILLNPQSGWLRSQMDAMASH